MELTVLIFGLVIPHYQHILFLDVIWYQWKYSTAAKAAKSSALEFRVASLLIPAKKWGDTEIAERGRSVLVMRARYRSAGLTPHQRGWTDAG